MYRFQCDYTEGAHPAIMQRMVETNMEQTDGYGLDPYCDSARPEQLKQPDIKYCRFQVETERSVPYR